jgi:nucleoid DNA-binding protein/cell division septation protein DedD
MDKYIKEYLLQHEKIQINNLGMLGTVYKPAEIHPILHTFTIPGKYVVFSENSVTDTNELAIFISSKENISIDLANSRILEWVNNIKTTIASKKEYTLSSLGKFFINAMGKMEFIPSLDTDISPESFGMEEFTISPPQKTKPKEEVETSTKEETKEPAVSKKSDSADAPKQSPITVNDKEKLQETEVRKNEDVDTTEIEDAEAEDDYLEEPIIGFGSKNIRKRTPGHTLLLVILFLLLCSALGIGITYFLYPEIVETYAKQLHLISCAPKITEEQTTVPEKEQKGKTTGRDEIPTQTKEKITPTETDTAKIKDNKTVTLPKQKQPAPFTENYYVILGSFQSMENAKAFLNQKQKEYANAIDLGKGQTSGLYLIGIGPYTKTEAENKIQNGIKGWILKK